MDIDKWKSGYIVTTWNKEETWHYHDKYSDNTLCRSRIFAPYTRLAYEIPPACHVCMNCDVMRTISDSGHNAWENHFAWELETVEELQGWKREQRFTKGSEGKKFDFAWPDKHLAVEIYGPYHSNAYQVELDRIRLNRAAALGWRVLVYNHVEVLLSLYDCFNEIAFSLGLGKVR